ncbi:MAG TPA: hypothetical protein VIF15_05420 [Polyangiaceae bacterium]
MADRKPGEIWKVLEEQAREDGEAELPELPELDDAAKDALLREAGITPETVAKDVQELLGRHGVAVKPEPAPEPVRAVEGGGGKPVPSAAVIPLRPRRTARSVWLVAAAMLGLMAAILAMNTAAIVAWLSPAPPGPPSQWAPPPQPPQPTPQQLAATLRKEAYAACAEGRWLPCAAKLDEARDRDQQGEDTPEVRAARKRIADAMNPDGSFNAKQ